MTAQEKINFILTNATKQFMKDFDEKAKSLPQNNEKTTPKVAYIPEKIHTETIIKKTDFSILENRNILL